MPKPVQKPHPPLWAACSNRDSLKLAARLGMGALTFAFANADEARFWVEEYYDTFKRECAPIGRVVNPNVAMLTGFMCHEDAETARARGVEGAQFFAFGLGHYWRDGTHVPGRLVLWDEFKREPQSRMEAIDRERKKAGMGGIGSPEQLLRNFRAYEDAGVDQLILLQQCGNYRQEHVCESLELFAARVLPDFEENNETREKQKRHALEPYIAAALRRMPPLDPLSEVPAVDAYPRLWAREGTGAQELAPDRRPGMAALWQLQVGGPTEGVRPATGEDP